MEERELMNWAEDIELLRQLPNMIFLILTTVSETGLRAGSHKDRAASV